MKWLTIFLTLGLASLYQFSNAEVEKVCADLVGSGGVGVRIWPTLKASPLRLHHHLTFRLVQINWEAEEIFDGDWVGVFPKDPRPPARRTNPLGLPIPQNGTPKMWDMPAPLYWDTPYATQGYLTSNVTQGRVELQMLAAGGCVGVWAAFIRNGLAIAADCLASHPSWLWQNRDVLGSRSLRSLVIPGTHNSGSYSLKDEDDVVSAWVVCQDEDIISQLLYGIRYLDLRVAYYPHTTELLWVNHDMVQWRPLVNILNEIQNFLTLSRDPVIIDIHRTPVGFELPEAIPLLLSLMSSTFGRDFLPDRFGPKVTLDQIWSTGKRVIFAYIDSDVAEEEDWIWPPLPQAWANAQILQDLQHYLDGQMTLRQSSPRIWAAMGHLTPSFWDLILRSHEGVRGLADRVNRPASTWLRERWAHLANIFATDFFRGNNIISLSIRTNLALSVCPSGNLHRPRYTYRSPSFLRRSTELPGQHSSSLIQQRNNYNEAVQSIFSTFSTSSTTSPLLQTLSPQFKQPGIINSSEHDYREVDVSHFPQETDKEMKEAESDRTGLPFISPIHSLLDIFGLNTTNTSTITSRLLPREPGYYDEDSDFLSLANGTENHDSASKALNDDRISRKKDSFVPSHISRRLPLLLETSVSISLQGDYEEDELQNSGDIPVKAPINNDSKMFNSKTSTFKTSFSFKELNFFLHDTTNEPNSNLSSLNNVSDSTADHNLSFLENPATIGQLQREFSEIIVTTTPKSSFTNRQTHNLSEQNISEGLDDSS